MGFTPAATAAGSMAHSLSVRRVLPSPWQTAVSKSTVVDLTSCIDVAEIMQRTSAVHVDAKRARLDEA